MCIFSNYWYTELFKSIADVSYVIPLGMAAWWLIRCIKYKLYTEMGAGSITMSNKIVKYLLMQKLLHAKSVYSQSE